jgi:hypothetical protein
LFSVKEYDELERKMEGSARRGERTDLTSLHRGEVWTQDKTARDLGISRQAVSKAIQIAAERLFKAWLTVPEKEPGFSREPFLFWGQKRGEIFQKGIKRVALDL